MQDETDSESLRSVRFSKLSAFCVLFIRTRESVAVVSFSHMGGITRLGIWPEKFSEARVMLGRSSRGSSVFFILLFRLPKTLRKVPRRNIHSRKSDLSSYPPNLEVGVHCLAVVNSCNLGTVVKAGASPLHGQKCLSQKRTFQVMGVCG